MFRSSPIVRGETCSRRYGIIVLVVLLGLDFEDERENDDEHDVPGINVQSQLVNAHAIP